MRQALLALITIGLVMSLAWAGALAYFSDTETSSGNTLQAGTLDLKVKNGDDDWKDGVTATWTLTDMKPSDTRVGVVAFKNVGSIAADHLEITCDYTVNDPLGPESDTQEDTPPDHMADYMIITEMIYYYNAGVIDLLTLLTDTDGDGIDLLELKDQGVDDLPPLNGTGDERFDMTLKFSEDAGNDFQGDMFDLTMIFTLNQDPSQ